MSRKVEILRSLVEQRLTLAAEEIFGLFERTIAEYEEELCRTKEERQIQDCVWNPKVHIHKTDIQKLSVVKEDLPSEQQEWNPIVDQEEPESEFPYFKEEQGELWTSPEVNITKFPSTPVTVKSEDDDEDKVKSSQLNQPHTEENKVEANKVGCGGSEPSSSFHLHRHLQRKTDDQNEDSEETDDSDEDQTLNHKPESNLPTNSSTEQMETETDGDGGGGSDPDNNLVHMESVKRRTFDSKSLLEEHMDTHTGQKLVGSSESEATFSQKKNTTQETNTPRNTMKKNELMLNDVGCKKKLYPCGVCSKTFFGKSSFEIHMRKHTGEKPFCCSLCGKRFERKAGLQSHMKSHMGEKQFRCSLCHIYLRDKSAVSTHMKIHSGEKPFNCSMCHKHFRCQSEVKRHMKIHTGEKPFSCSVCHKCFRDKSKVKRHMKIHTGEKPFSCSECSKRFSWKQDLDRHIMFHTGERPFTCIFCEKGFIRQDHLRTHMKIHTKQ